MSYRGFKKNRYGNAIFNRNFLSLRDSARDPNLKVEEDDLTVTIKDKFPKAKHHYLILPKDDIKNLQQLRADQHLPLVKHLHQRAEKLIQDIKSKNNQHQLDFKFGYHAIPSMTPLHIHIISQDFDSPSLKTKKHWNSFTTSFFLLSTNVIQELEKKNSITLNKELYESFLTSPLQCHKCSYYPKHMPDLKQHLRMKHS